MQKDKVQRFYQEISLGCFDIFDQWLTEEEEGWYNCCGIMDDRFYAKLISELSKTHRVGLIYDTDADSDEYFWSLVLVESLESGNHTLRTLSETRLTQLKVRNESHFLLDNYILSRVYNWLLAKENVSLFYTFFEYAIAENKKIKELFYKWCKDDSHDYTRQATSIRRLAQDEKFRQLIYDIGSSEEMKSCGFKPNENIVEICDKTVIASNANSRYVIVELILDGVIQSDILRYVIQRYFV